MKIAVMGSGGVGGYYSDLFAQQGHAMTCVAGALDVKNYTRGLEGQVSQRSKSSQRAMPAIFEVNVPEKVIFSATIIARKP